MDRTGVETALATSLVALGGVGIMASALVVVGDYSRMVFAVGLVFVILGLAVFLGALRRSRNTTAPIPESTPTVSIDLAGASDAMVEDLRSTADKAIDAQGAKRFAARRVGHKPAQR